MGSPDVILVWNKGKLEVEMLELIGSEKKYRNFREKLFSYNRDYQIIFRIDREYNLRPNLLCFLQL